MSELNPSNVSEDAIEMLLSKDKNKKSSASRQISENKILENKMKLAAMLKGDNPEYVRDMVSNINTINSIAENKVVTEGGNVEDRPVNRGGYQQPAIMSEQERMPDDIENLIKQKYQKERNYNTSNLVNESEILGLLNKKSQPRQIVSESYNENLDIDSKIKDAVIKVLAEMLTEEKIKRVLMETLKKMKK